MSDVPTWTLFAYMTGDAEGAQDERRLVAPWQLKSVLDWCVHRGYDHIYFSRDPVETTRFEKAAPAPVKHHGIHLVEGSRGEQTGDAA